MTARRAKQLIYGMLYGILWVGFFALVYAVFLRPVVTAPPPPCVGENCAPAGVTHLVVQGDVSVFETGPGSATFLAQVSNPNTDFGASSFDYRFDLFDATGKAVGSYEGTSYIYPSQVKYIVLPNQAIDVPYDHATMAISNVRWTDGLLGVAPQFAFSNLRTAVASSTVTIGGSIENRDITAFPAVTIVAIFKGRAGGAIGASQTEVDNVAPDAVLDFSVIYPAVNGVDPAESQLFAYALKQ